jgi:hypothetical protein
MNQLRVQLVQGNKDKSPGMHERMGNNQPFLVNPMTSIQEDIQIDDTRFPFLFSDPAHGRFNGHQMYQQVSRREFRIHTNGAIHIPVLAFNTYRFRTVKAGPGLHTTPWQRIHLVDSHVAIGNLVTQVAAYPDIRLFNQRFFQYAIFFSLSTASSSRSFF